MTSQGDFPRGKALIRHRKSITPDFGELMIEGNNRKRQRCAI